LIERNNVTETPVEFTYDSAKLRSPFIREAVELWHYRDLLSLLVSNSLKTRYKRSVLGVAWSVLTPLLETIILTLAFATLFGFRVENFPVYLLSGLLAWQFFQQATIASVNRMVWGSKLMTRVYTPRAIFAVSIVGNAVTNLLISLLVLAAIMVALGQPFKISLVMLPLSILLLTMFTMGLGLLVATFAVYFTDIAEMYQVLLRAWFYASAIIYPAEIIPEKYKFILTLNPMFHLIQTFREPVYYGVFSSWSTLLVASGFSIGMLLLGWWVFTRQANDFAYRI
jgi:ABC-type polysaccharide/polyol phosphate export permease